MCSMIQYVNINNGIDVLLRAPPGGVLYHWRLVGHTVWSPSEQHYKVALSARCHKSVLVLVFSYMLLRYQLEIEIETV